MLRNLKRQKKRNGGDEAPVKKALAQIMITQLDNGTIEVGIRGIQQSNLLAVGTLLTEAHRILLNNVAMALKEQNQSRIVTPGGAKSAGGIYTPGKG